MSQAGLDDIDLDLTLPPLLCCSSKKKKRMADKILPWKVRDLVPESQAYMDLLAFERKLDATIMRKRLDIQVPTDRRYCTLLHKLQCFSVLFQMVVFHLLVSISYLSTQFFC